LVGCGNNVRRAERRESPEPPVYDWFTDGFATPDLKEAKAFSGPALFLRRRRAQAGQWSEGSKIKRREHHIAPAR
jgi:hypothetical protein